jgi:hypothetical protein
MPRTHWFQAVTRRCHRSSHRPSLESLEGRLLPTVTLSISNPLPFPKPDTGQIQGLFVVTRSGDLAPAVQVNFATQDGTGPGAAHAGTDFVATSGTLTFAANQTTATIAVTILGNNVFQADRQFTVTLSNPTGSGVSFAPQQPFATGQEPYSVAVADMNGDGRPDLVVANRGTGTVSVLLNTTLAGALIPSFAPQQTFFAIGDAQAVIAADLNGDGRPDLAIANTGPNLVSVLLNTTLPGSPVVTFALEQNFPSNGNPDSLAAADINGDGRLDLVVANAVNGIGGVATVSVLLNRTPLRSNVPDFAPPQPFPVGITARSVAVADFNGDGRPDVAVANRDSHTVSVLLNTTVRGSAVVSFTPQRSFPIVVSTFSPSSVAAGDINGDGRPDLVLADSGSASVSVLLNTTPPGAIVPSFTAQQVFPVSPNPTAVTLADLNGDGLPDVVVTNGDFNDFPLGGSSNTVSVLLNTTPPGAATASFSLQAFFPTQLRPRSVAVGDFNGDGRPDLAVANVASATVSVLLNNTGLVTILGSPATGTISSAAQAPVTIATVAGTTPQSAALNTTFAAPLAVEVRDAAGQLVQNVTVTFAAATAGPSGSFGGAGTSVTVVTDASGRASAPLFVANTSAGSNTVTAHAAGGSNPSTRFFLTNLLARTSSLAALDSQTGAWSLAVPNGASFAGAPAASWNPSITWVDVQAGDLNGDGRTDIIGRDQSSGAWWVGLSDGAGHFTTTPWAVWSPAVHWVDVHLGDFDGDGKMDVVGRAREDGTWWVGRSTGSSFQTSLWGVWSSAATWADVMVGDLNGDGKADLIGRYPAAGQWWAAISTGSSFTNALWGAWAPDQPGTLDWVDLRLADLNGDGRADVVGRLRENGQWWVSLSGASGVSSTSLWATWSPAVTWVDVRLGDFDGDGRLDLTGRVLQDGSWWVGRSTGTSFTTSWWTAWNPGVTWVDVQVGDFNGDGKADLVGRVAQDGSWWAALSTGTSFTNSWWGRWNAASAGLDVYTGHFI